MIFFLNLDYKNMADLQRALDYARNNPEDPRSKKLLEAVANGKITSDAVQAKQIQQEHQATLGENVKDFAKGFGKGVFNTVQGAAEVGNEVFGDIAQKIVGGQKNELKKMPEELTTPSNTAQKLGFGTEQVGEFFVPGGVISKAATKGEKVAKITQEAVKLGGVSSAQNSNVKDAGVDALVALGLGVVGAGATKAVKPLKEVLSEKVPGRMLNSIIKPGVNDFNFGKDPGKAVVKEGITGKSLEDLFKKISEKKREIGSQISAEVKNIKPGTTIDLSTIFSKIDDKITSATENGEPALVSRLQSIKDGLTKTYKNTEGKLVETGKKNLVVTPEEAWKIKQDIGKATKWTNQAFDAEANQARVEIYKGIANELEKLSPSMKPLNKRYANMLTAQKSAERRIVSLQKQNQIGLGDLVTAGVGVVGGGVVGGLGTYAAKKALGSTLVQSKTAQFLSKIDKNDRSIIEKYLPAIQKYYIGTKDK